MREWLPTGTTIGRYQISSRLSASGLGEVYLAKEIATGREVALKIFSSALIEDESLRIGFLNVFNPIKNLRHRNIAEIYEAGLLNDDRPFIASEYVKGQSLDSFGYGHQLSIKEIVEIIIQIASGLQASHGMGWLHLAIKPSNIILTADKRVKIIDYGQALVFPRSLSNDQKDPLRADLQTVRHLSPEQIFGLSPDQRSDIFSLGAVIYELLTGLPAFAGETVDQVVSAIVSKNPLPLTELRDDLPRELVRIVDKALSREITARYQTAGEMIEDLKSLTSRKPRWLEWLTSDSTDSQPEIGDGSRTGGPAGDRQPEQKAAKSHSLSPASIIDDLKRAYRYLLDYSQKRKSPLDQTGLHRQRSITEDLRYLLKHHWRRMLVIATLLMVIFGGAWVIAKYLINAIDPERSQRSVTRFTDNGKVVEAVISPDGENIVYSVEEDGQHSLFVKAPSGQGERRLAALSAKECRSLTFMPDSRWVGFIKSEPGQEYGRLFRLSLIDGVEEDLGKGDSVGAFSFSLDGRRMVYLTASEDRTETKLKLSRNTGAERVLAKKVGPAFYDPNGLAWSLDERVVAAAARDSESGLYLKIVLVDVETGVESTLVPGRWSEIDRMVWMNDGSGLLVTASEPTSHSSQIWSVAYPSGEVKRISQEAGDFHGVSLDERSSSLVTIQRDSFSSLSIASSENFSRPQRLVSDHFEGSHGLAWTADGRIVYVSSDGGRETIWIFDPKTGEKHPLPVAPEGGNGREHSPAVSLDGNFIAYIVERSNGSYLWRSDLNRRNVKKLTDENLVFYPSFSADGRSIVYSALREARRVVLRSPIEGGIPEVLIEKQSWRPALSPYGTMLACNYLDESSAQWKLALFQSNGGLPQMIFDAPGNYQRVIRWMPDGAGLSYLVTRGGASNIWVQPLAGGMPTQLTDFRAGRIFDFAWSRDGEQVAYALGGVSGNIVLIRNFRER